MMELRKWNHTGDKGDGDIGEVSIISTDTRVTLCEKKLFNKYIKLMYVPSV